MLIFFWQQPYRMDSKYWGKSLWHSMFCIAANFPETYDAKNKEHRSIRKRQKAFFDTLPHVLPCYYCRESTLNVLTKVAPLDYSGRRQLMATLYVWKAMVNEKLTSQDNKHRHLPSFDTVYKKYTKLLANCSR